MPTLPADTLRLDTALIHSLQGQDDFDYTRELVQSDFSVWEWFWDEVDRLLTPLFENRFYEQHSTLLWSAVGLGLLLAVLVFLYNKRPHLFRRVRQSPLDYEVQEDTIYGIDFAEAIAKARAAGNHREALRLVYLQTLRMLSDGGHIDWQPYKTPSQYAREYGSETFRTLSDRFLRVRYGNFEATAASVEEALALQAALAASLPTAPGHHPEEEGGQP